MGNSQRKMRRGSGGLSEACEWWQTLVQSAADAIVVHCDGRIIFANPRAAEMFAADTPQALVGQAAIELVHPASRELARARIHKVVSQGGSCPPRELRYLRLDGSWFWGEARTSRVHWRGRPAVLVIIRDVTERRRSAERLRDFAELAADWFWETDAELRYVWFSEDVEAKTGIPAAWHYGKTRLEIIGTGLDPQQLAEHKQILEARLPYRDFEFPRRGPSGEQHWIRSNGKPIFDEDGKFLGYRGTGRDITAEKRAQIALRESEERYRQLVDLAPNAVLVHVQGLIRYANRRAAEYVGLAAPEQLIGRSIFEFVAPEQRALVQARIEKLAAGSTSLPPIELPIRRVDGIERWLEVRSAAILDHGVPAVLVVASDITERRRSEERLAFLARHDPLTGLANRMLIADRLEQAVRLARRRGDLCGLLLLDLDGFKSINDTFGHMIGDRVLREVADRMRAELRACDTVGRLGGDEFAIVLPHLQSAAGAELVAQRLLAALARPLPIGGASWRVSASIGIAIGPEHACDAESLLRCADLALYQVKARAGGNWLVYEPGMLQQELYRRQIEAALRRHLAAGELEVFYQPLVELASGRIVGAEAVVRWPTTATECVQPDVFVPIAEASGLIGELGQFVLSRAVADGMRFSALAGEPLRIAINVSPQELMARDYAKRVQAILKRTAFPAARLELELTERVLLEPTGPLVATLEALRATGVQLAIDDFGTGYSSLVYLKRLPVHRLKVDRSFISGLPNDADDLAIVETIVRLASALGLPVTAEGIERPEQHACLKQLGVIEGQGYLWAPPLQSSAFEALLRDTRAKYADDKLKMAMQAA